MCTKFFKKVWDAINPENPIIEKEIEPVDNPPMFKDRPRCDVCGRVVGKSEHLVIMCKCEPKP